MTLLVPAVEAAVRARWPERGAAWSAAVSGELDTICADLRLTPDRTYPARYAFVVQATSSSGARVVIRSTPDPDAEHQAAVLLRLADAGLAPTVHAIESTPTATWTVTDAVDPGTSLRNAASEQRRTADIVAVLRVLAENRDGPPQVPDLASWIRARLTTPPLDDIPPHLEPTSEHQRRQALDALEALGPPPAARLCHGDLSPGNALIGRNRLWLIDPRGINGEPAYDIAVVALKSCGDDPSAAVEFASSLAQAANADPDRAVRWVPIAAAATV